MTVDDKTAAVDGETQYKDKYPNKENPMVDIAWTARTHNGRARHESHDPEHTLNPINDDAISVVNQSYVEGRHAFALADGMGGLPAGYRASHAAAAAATRDWATIYPLNVQTPVECIEHAFFAAQLDVTEAGSTDMVHATMGTTLTLVTLDDAQVTVGHVGDSRAYIYRWAQDRDRLEQLTQDHGHGSALNRALVAHRLSPKIIPDTTTLTASDGDILLMCSDGLTDFVDNDRIEEIITHVLDHELANSTEDDTTRTIAERLVYEALDNQKVGHADNISVIVISII